ncbi:TPA: hypothetical protein ACH3X3_011644 [Trebouxia sp. C0006]
MSNKYMVTADHNSNFIRLHPGAHASMQANKQAALVQELVRRQHVSCPAHPAFREPHEDHVGSGIHSDDAPQTVSAPSAAAARLESYFASPSFDRIAATHTGLTQAPGYSIPSDCFMSAGSWAAFCIKHDLMHARHTAKDDQLSSRMRHIQLRAAFADTNVSRAVAKDPLLLSYCPTTLTRHMEHLQLLFGNSGASAMVAKMPTLLHYRTATLSAKLDGLYDLLPHADVSKMVTRSPFLLGLSSQTLATRFQALQTAFPDANVQRMVEYYPSLLECKVGKVIGNLKALQQLFPDTVNAVAVVEYMPTLLLSNMQKVEEKYTRMQILCMHRPRWRKDFIASQQKSATFARLLGVSHRVIDRLSFLLEHQDLADLAASTIMLMSRSKFATRFEQFEAWQQQRHAAQHINIWQSDNALSLLDSLDQPLRLSSGSETHNRKKKIAL